MGEERRVPVEAARRIADPSIGKADPDTIVAASKGTFIDKPGVEIKIDKVAVAGCAGQPQEARKPGIAFLLPD